jgi:hypothetical protein
LLKTKAKVQFDRAVTERSKVFFCVFGGQICLNFSLVFSLLLFGRQRVANCEVARRKTRALAEPGSGLARWNFAALQLVIVSCRWPKAGALSAIEGVPAQPGAERSKSSEASPKLADC